MPGNFAYTPALQPRQTVPPEPLGRPAPSIEWRHAAPGDRWVPMVDVSGAIPGAGTSDPDDPQAPLDARLFHLTPGLVDVGTVVPDSPRWSALLILDGLVMLELGAGRGHAAWLLGEDDLLTPSTLGRFPLTRRSRWRILAPTWVAQLDPGFTDAGRVVPAVMPWIVARATRSTSWLLAKSLVMSSPIVEERLLLLFALYAERWGVVRRDGILLRLPLTHRLLGALCGVRRPSVTIALRKLERAGVLKRASSGAWLLARDGVTPTASHHSCWPEYAAALGFGTE